MPPANLEPLSWLRARFGTDSARWRLPPDASALHLWGAEDRPRAEMAMTAAQTEAIRALTGSLATLPLEGRIEGIDLKLRLIGRRTDRSEWMGVATSFGDTEAVLTEMEHGLSFTEQVISEVNALIVIIDASGKIRRFNQECERLSGRTEAEMLGRDMDLFFPTEDARKIRANLATFFPGKTCWDTERQLLTKNGPRTVVWRNRLIHSPTLGQWFLVCSGNDVTEQRLAQARLLELATVDPITGLANRHAIQEAIRAAVGRPVEHRIDLLFLDLDSFKNVNDNYGHSVGDRLLQQVAAGLRACVQSGDLVSRFGGDSFLLMLDNATAERTDTACRRIRDLVEQPFLLNGIEVYSGCSMGVASFPEHGESMDELVRNAESAMYAAKESNRGGNRRFDPAMNGQRNEIMWLHTNLRHALAENQFQLYYQRNCPGS